MKQTLTRLHPVDMAVLLALFEGATLFVMALAMEFLRPRGTFLGDALLGAIIGLLGTPIALGIWHLGRLRLRGTLHNKPFTLTHINVIPASAANAVFLVVLFWIEDLIRAITDVPFVGIALLGLVATTLSILLLLFIYNLQPLKIWVTIGYPERIARAGPLAAVFAGIFEAVILPIMSWLMTLPLPTVASFTIAGMVSGFIGGLVGTWILNLFAPWLKPWLDL
ncbi:hypothetical protein HY493_01660 [Candidatus Woesearchaeota archaeon]|nr:hypothetical protein [Candidatus Woesearchaeota archaeon]